MHLHNACGSGSTYFYSEKYFSKVLLAVCDSNNRFTFVDIGVDSVLFQKMLENTFNTSDDRQVSVDGDLLSFIFVGDEAFGLSSRMVRPYRGKNLSQKKEIFIIDRLSRVLKLS